MMLIKNKRTSIEYEISTEGWESLREQKLAKLFSIVSMDTYVPISEKKIEIPEAIIDFRAKHITPTVRTGENANFVSTATAPLSDLEPKEQTLTNKVKRIPKPKSNE